MTSDTTELLQRCSCVDAWRSSDTPMDAHILNFIATWGQVLGITNWLIHPQIKRTQYKSDRGTFISQSWSGWSGKEENICLSQELNSACKA